MRIPEASRGFLTVEAAKPEQEGLGIGAPARVAFRDDAVSQVGAPLAGRVVDVRVRTGDRVKRGDALVVLHCPEAAAARTQLTTALATLRSAQAAVERERRMLSQGVGIERDKLVAEVHLAEVQAEVARARATNEFVGGGEGAVVTLRAQIAGTIFSRRATVGLAVESGGDPLVEIGNPSALWLVADVFERDLPMVKEGARVAVELPSVSESLTGKVISIGTVVSSDLRTAPVRITMEGGAAVLRPGMFGRAQIAVSGAGLTLPTEAVLIKDGRESVVYVAQDPLTFERRVVVVGQSIEGRVQVISGLKAGEKVVVRGALLLDGTAEQLL